MVIVDRVKGENLFKIHMSEKYLSFYLHFKEIFNIYFWGWGAVHFRYSLDKGLFYFYLSSFFSYLQFNCHPKRTP